MDEISATCLETDLKSLVLEAHEYITFLAFSLNSFLTVTSFSDTEICLLPNKTGKVIFESNCSFVYGV